jgi:hypothetical protein
VHIGRPFQLPQLERRARAKDLAALTHYIMVHIANELPERYHGIYTHSPALTALQNEADPWPFCQEAVKIQTLPPE